MKTGTKSFLFITSGIFGLYLLYAFIFGVVLFNFHQPKMSIVDHNGEMDYKESQSDDRVVLVEDRIDAGLARINLIENAESTLDIAYYTLHGGKSRDILFASIVEAADRGVQVRIMLDGLFHNIRGKDKDSLLAFTYHPNVEVKLYEPLDLLQPWTWNNRLHDKLMIVDNTLAMIGGRNIGDNYFAPEKYHGATNDRDVMIINMEQEKSVDSVINEISHYFHYVWEHEFSQMPIEVLSTRREALAQEKLTELRELVALFHESDSELFNHEIDWIAQSFPTNQITFVHNPIERLNKEPIVWREITRLIEEAEKSILIQSPYIIPTNQMRHYLNNGKITVNQISMLTNSLAASPNVIAFSGYRQHRESIAANVNLYEYQNPLESLHAKTFVFDSKISVIGSFNLDSRSTFLSTESVVIIDSEEFATLVESKIEQIIDNDSLQVTGEGTYRTNPSVEEGTVSLLKLSVTRSLSLVTRFFQYML
ncbi:phospholipase D-like domain-containing protein [Bacillus sp. FJAT-45350]|uniref:phospholipase D-like domain-containing protein n=1 Tax=Bacillus sp. FJAT-45350 TaxID=2011014 RepID=UPI000BB8C7AD|nr:phospholipase D family protein [Bacillus sp. FJAT-45350]